MTAAAERAELRLAERMRALTGQMPCDRRRALSTTRDPSGLIAFLAEIDETILPRALLFQNGRGQTLKAEVASRRLLRLAEGPHLDRTADTGNLRNGLTAFLAGAPSLTVESGPIADPPPTAGLAAEWLADIWQLTLYQGTPPAEAVASFLAGIAHDSFAWRHEDRGALVASAGDPSALDRLAALTPPESTGRPGCVLLAPRPGEGLATLFLTYRGHHLRLLLPQTRLNAAADAWFRAIIRAS